MDQGLGDVRILLLVFWKTSFKDRITRKTIDIRALSETKAHKLHKFKDMISNSSLVRVTPVKRAHGRNSLINLTLNGAHSVQPTILSYFPHLLM